MNPQLLNNRYRILQNLGSGGFGNTFLAEDTHMPSGRRCVIKQLKPVTNDPQMYQQIQQRFGREAATLEELGEGSDRIPKLYAYFSEGGQFYLVQEFVDGQTLTKMVQQGRLPENTVKEILISLLPVLDYVHSKRMVHRDIKPDNIIVRQRDNKPVLIDFGAVKESMGVAVNSPGNPAPSIVIGTPGYMPPEQLAGQPVYSSDLYSLGLTAIYMLTGKMPQELQSDPRTGEILWRHVNVSPSLAAVLDKAIQYSPRDRYSTAREMLDALQSGAVSPAVIPATEQPTVAISPGVQHHPGSSPQTVPAIAPPYQGGGQKNPPKVLLIGGAIAASLVAAAVAFGLISKRSNAPSTPIASSPQPASEAPVRSQSPATIPDRSPPKRSEVTPPLVIASPSPEPVQSRSPEPTRSPEPVQSRSPEPTRSESGGEVRSPQPSPSPQNNQNPTSPTKVPAFTTGTTRSAVEASLGVPDSDVSGRWRTRAVTYNLVSKQIDLGYLFDRNSGVLRQTEASFAQSVDPQVMLSTVDGLLPGGATNDIKRGLQQVQQRQRSSYRFTAGSLKGQIVRQDCDFIYISIWDADLHEFEPVEKSRKC